MIIGWYQQGTPQRLGVGTSRRIRMCASWMVLAGALVLGVACGASDLWAAAPESDLAGVQQAMKEQRYQDAVNLLDALPAARAAAAEVRRLRVRAFVGLNKPKEAFEVYEQLAVTLGKDDEALLQEVAFPFISIMFKDMRDQMRGASYTAAKELESDAMVPYFEDGLTDGSGLVRALAAESLSLLPKGRQSARLRKAMDDEAAMVRANVVHAVGLQGNKSELPLLEQAMKDEQPMVRVQAMAALLRFGKKDMWASLAGAAEAANPEARATALRLIGELKDVRGVPLAIARSKDPMPSVRGGAAAALGLLGKKEGLEALTALVHDKIPAVRSAAAVALGELETKDAVPVLKQALDDVDPGVRGAAVDSLLRMNEPFPDIEPAIRKLMLGQDPGPRSAVGKALARASGRNRQAALAYLEQLIQDTLPRPRIAAARSLGRIGDREYIPLLKSVLKDPDPAVQSTAAASLIRLLRGSSRDSQS